MEFERQECSEFLMRGKVERGKMVSSFILLSIFFKFNNVCLFSEEEMIGYITNSMDMNLSNLWETVSEREAWHAAVHGVTKSQTQFSE